MWKSLFAETQIQKGQWDVNGEVMVKMQIIQDPPPLMCSLNEGQSSPLVIAPL